MRLNIQCQAPLLLPLLSGVPSSFIPGLYTLADLGSTWALIKIASHRTARQKDGTVQNWWVAVM